MSVPPFYRSRDVSYVLCAGFLCSLIRRQDAGSCCGYQLLSNGTPCICLSCSVQVYLPVCLCLFLCLSVNVSVCLSVCLSVCTLSVCLSGLFVLCLYSVCLSVCLPAHISVVLTKNLPIVVSTRHKHMSSVFRAIV